MLKIHFYKQYYEPVLMSNSIAFSPFQSLFAKGVLHLQSQGSVVTGPAETRHSYWIVGRDNLHFTRLDLRPIPPRDYKGYIHNKLSQLSPFTQFDSYLIIRDQQALVWIWDQELQQKLAMEAGCIDCPVVPETVMQPPVHTETKTIRLVSCLHGIDCQYWQDGQLYACHWWPTQPDQDVVAQFYHRCGITIPDSTSITLETERLAKPWAINHIAHHDATINSILLIGWPLTLFTLLFLFSQAMASYISGAMEHYNLNKEITALTANNESVLTIKNKALLNINQLNEYSRIQTIHRQLKLLSIISSKLPQGNKNKILRWNFNNDQLDIDIIGNKLDPSYFVEQYQKLAEFKTVFAEPGVKKGSLHLRFQITPR